MEKRERMVIEAFLGLIFVIFLIIMILLFLNLDTNKKTTTTISNSYNVNSYNTYTTPSTKSTTEYLSDSQRYCKIVRIYDDEDYLDYSHRAYHKTERGIFGNDINKHIIYVENREHTGGYFKVIFYFTDYYGDIDTKSVTYYIRPHEEKKFFYTRVYDDEHEYHHWDYEVISETKILNSDTYETKKICY